VQGRRESRRREIGQKHHQTLCDPLPGPHVARANAEIESRARVF